MTERAEGGEQWLMAYTGEGLIFGVLRYVLGEDVEETSMSQIYFT